MTQEAASPVVLLIGAGGGDRAEVERALRDAGLRVTSATEQEALAGRELGSPRVVVLDDGAPQVEREAAQLRLLAHPQLHGAPFVVLSDECTVESFSGAIAKGAAAYVTRPLVPGDLQDVATRLATWPRGAHRADGRRRARRPLLLDVDYEAQGQTGRQRGLIVDVSAGGCRMELRGPVPRGAQIAFIPRACERSTEIRLSGQVRWNRPTADGRHLAAVRFTGAGGMLAAQILGAVPRRLE